ncbi:hypothetical protein [Methylobrevis pamukkalensis]|uniref:Uncharacterized protein n=1 Tax=Methylobrevis pamukkalensis TaxID=1439726 RepID=A0A1E3GXQ9_9HYPH|nr:hypothetical protein [Methylobrevis pamukkalensis]ODN68848.1 hypothetical protein A6302_03853 [Methylobrevis pamukkalensis]
MNMQPGSFTVYAGSQIARLAPTLGFALFVEERPGGAPALLAELRDGQITAVLDVIDHFDDVIGRRFSASDLAEIGPRVIDLVLGIFTADDGEAPATGKGGGATVTHAEHLAWSFRAATGWLGWTPAEAYAATIPEIRQAYRGRVDMLGAIFGGGEERPDVPIEKKWRATFTALGTKKVPPARLR